MFTAWRIAPVVRKSTSSSTPSTATWVWASSVLAPRCGVQTTPGMPNSGLSVQGSVSKHVERDAGDLAGFQSFDQRRFVVDAAAGAVDQPHAGLQQCQRFAVDEAGGFVGQRRVDGEIIDLRQHVANVSTRLDAQLGGPLLAEERIVAEHAHLEGLGPLGDRLADAAQADDAERLAGQLRAHVLVAVPLALDQALIGRGDVAREGQHQRERVLGGAERVAGRRVHHHDAQPRGGVFVDVVGADAGPHDRLELLIAVQRLRR